MGRNPKPASICTGNKMTKEEKERIDKVERELAPFYDEISSVPEVLQSNKLAVNYYNFLVNNILQANLPISNVDIPLITEASFALAIVHEARKDILKNGTTEEREDKNGNFAGSQVRAIVRIENTYSESYRKIATKLGLDPSSRSAIARAQVIDMTETEDGLFD